MLGRVGNGRTSGRNTGWENDLSTALSNVVVKISNEWELSDEEYSQYVSYIDKYFIDYWNDLSPLVGADGQNLMWQLCLSILGAAMPYFITPNHKWYSDDVMKADSMINALDASRSRQNNRGGVGGVGSRSNQNSGVGISRNASSQPSQRGSAYSTTTNRRVENRKPSLMPEDDMYEVKNYRHGGATIPHTSAPLKQTLGGTKPVVGVTRIRITLPPVIDRTNEFEKDDNPSLDQMSHEPTVVSYQLGTISDLVQKDIPSLYKWWTEEHMVCGSNVSTPESDRRLTAIFNAFSTIDSFDTLIDLMKELDTMSKSEIVIWLSNRITNETLEFIQRNYECADKLVSTSYLRKPVDAIEELDYYGIKDPVIKQILATFRKLFKDWAFLVLRKVDDAIAEIAEFNAEDGIGTGGSGDTVSTTVLLRYAKSILVLPIITLYYKYGCVEAGINNKSLFVLSPKPCITTDAIDALIQNVINKYNDPHDHELLIVDKTLTMYRTFRLCNEPPTEVFYEIERVTI